MAVCSNIMALIVEWEYTDIDHVLIVISVLCPDRLLTMLNMREIPC